MRYDYYIALAAELQTSGFCELIVKVVKPYRWCCDEYDNLLLILMSLWIL